MLLWRANQAEGFEDDELPEASVPDSQRRDHRWEGGAVHSETIRRAAPTNCFADIEEMGLPILHIRL